METILNPKIIPAIGKESPLKIRRISASDYSTIAVLMFVGMEELATL